MPPSNTHVRAPERLPEQAEVRPSRPAGWTREKKPNRFVIKIGGVIPS